jgi:hypothetical protein
LLRAELPCIFEHSGRDDEDAVDDLLPLVAGEQVNAELNLSCCAAVHQSFDVKGFGRPGRAGAGLREPGSDAAGHRCAVDRRLDSAWRRLGSGRMMMIMSRAAIANLATSSPQVGALVLAMTPGMMLEIAW